MLKNLRNLFMAPFLGALFVIFLPFAGFGVLLWCIAERGRSLLKETPPLRGNNRA